MYTATPVGVKVRVLEQSDLLWLRLSSSCSYWNIGQWVPSTCSGPLQPLTPISLSSSLNVCLHVFFGLPLFLLPPLAPSPLPHSLGSRSTCPAIFFLLTEIMSDSSAPALLITLSLVMWSRHEIELWGIVSRSILHVGDACSLRSRLTGVSRCWVWWP